MLIITALAFLVLLRQCLLAQVLSLVSDRDFALWNGKTTEFEHFREFPVNYRFDISFTARTVISECGVNCLAIFGRFADERLLILKMNTTDNSTKVFFVQ